MCQGKRPGYELHSTLYHYYSMHTMVCLTTVGSTQSTFS